MSHNVPTKTHIDFNDFTPQNAFQYTRPSIYAEFFNILYAWVVHRSTITATLQWLNLLDVNYLDIIYGFKKFLPGRLVGRLVDRRIWYLVLQEWLRRSMEVEWSVEDWTRIWYGRREGR
ncbi:uncharacterized protein EAF01_006089 [Botrytis porri]|uniref:uncharacterized protein n=1 Tax=Botrytis porri TaxID=87229 RepID=UPI00190084D3|nr:uncharacterized protein EAF01_006089 [Botrytis porri]KAF7905568.1 hypothetical protein EAF01_006089 [Botrytis porri]